MRRYAAYLIIALITFSLSAFVSIQSYRQSVNIAPPQIEVIPQQPSSIDNSINIHRYQTEPNPIPEVPLAIKTELDKRFPDWRFPKIDPEIGRYLREHHTPDMYPEFISGDFDGNGQIDYAALIEDGTALLNEEGVPVEASRQLIVFLKNGKKFKFHSLDQASEYIALIKKGERGYSYETDKKFTYKNDAIFTGFWEKGGVSLVYEKGKFRSIVTSD
jgi:hypothetical protein